MVVRRKPISGEEQVEDRGLSAPTERERGGGDEVTEDHEPDEVGAGLVAVRPGHQLDSAERHGWVLDGEVAVGPALGRRDLREPGDIGRGPNRRPGFELAK